MKFVNHFFELNKHIVKTLQGMTPRFGYNGFGEFLFYRTYSRKKPDGSPESWCDTVIRVMNGLFSIRKDWYIRNHIPWDESFWQEYAERVAISMFKMEWLPPGRGLWAMGSDYVYERGAMALYNCAYTEIDDNIGDSVSWAMDSLMNGVGVGFGPTRNDRLRAYIPHSRVKTHTIPDTREGWCESVQLLIESFLKPDSCKYVFDYSLIRGKGLPIKGFGGLASGPEPLMQLHADICVYFEMYISDPNYDSVMLKTDILNAVGCCVVAGNVRRSAEIALGEITDPVFMDLKDYKKYPYREGIGWMSNNSVYLRKSDDFEKLGEISQRVKAKGEPGYINMVNFAKGRLGHSDNDIKIDRATGINPCQPSNAWLLTKDGLRQLKDIEIGSYIWSSEKWTKVVNKWSTGVKPVYRYITTAGIFLGTDNHRIKENGFKIEVKNAIGIDCLEGQDLDSVKHNPQAIMDGFLLGDGSYKVNEILGQIGENDQDLFNSEIKHLIHANYNKDNMYRVTTTLTEMPLTYNREIPEKYIMSDNNIKASFLRGLYTANGSICGNRITLKATSFKVIEQTQMMLSSLGIRSYWTCNKAKDVEFKNGIYECKKSFDLNISFDRKKFKKLIGFIQKYKFDKLTNLCDSIGKSKYSNEKYKNTYDIVAVEYVGNEEVFDITVDNSSHTYWTQCCDVSNCGEIPLESREVCNLSETFPTNCKDFNHWLRACEYATFYCSTVTLLPTHQQSTNAIIARNRRIGVGIVDFTGWKHTEGVHKVTRYLREGYKTVRSVNKWLAAEAGIPESIRVTTMKPGGTVPKIVGKTSGCGYPTFHHTKRRVRVQEGSPVANMLHDAGYESEPDFYSKNTLVFSFPILQGPAKPSAEVSLWEQAFNLILLQREWADNAVSNTLYFRPAWPLSAFYPFESTTVYDMDTHWRIETTNDIIELNRNEHRIERGIQGGMDVYKVFSYDRGHEEDIISDVISMIAPHTKSVSLLPHTAKGVYMQMPEEGITPEEYNAMLENVEPIDWTKLRDSDGQDEKYCDGDKCEIPVAG